MNDRHSHAAHTAEDMLAPSIRSPGRRRDRDAAPLTADPPASIGFAAGGLPVLGHAWWLRFRPLEFLTAQRVLGDIVEFRIGPQRAYLVNSPELVHQMLTSRRSDFIKGGPLLDTGRVLVGDSLGTSNGDLHRRQRRVIQPAFHPSRFPAYCTVMARTAAATVDSWRDGQQLEVNHQMYALSATVMATCLYSGQLATQAVEEIIRSLPTALDGIGRRAALPVRWLHVLPTPLATGATPTRCTGCIPSPTGSSPTTGPTGPTTTTCCPPS